MRTRQQLGVWDLRSYATIQTVWGETESYQFSIDYRHNDQNMPNGQRKQLGLLRMAQNGSIAGLEGRLASWLSILF